MPRYWDNPDDPDCEVLRKKTYMPEDARYREKWQMALYLIDLVRTDDVPHRAVVADSWYGNVTEFRQKLDDRKEWYIVGVHSDTEVFLESPVFMEPSPFPNEKKRGRPRRYPKLTETNVFSTRCSASDRHISDEDVDLKTIIYLSE